jgi:hypothetical protein
MGRAAPLCGLSAAILLAAACGGNGIPVAAAGPDRSDAWAAASGYAEFVAADPEYEALWREQAERGAPADLVARARDAGRWNLLVLAETWCPDAVYAVPFLAALADSVAALELRLLRVEGHEDLFAGHERNGRVAHPLVLVLDPAGRVRAGWVERPGELAAWIDARRGAIPDDDIRLYRNGWYQGNAGRAAMTEVLDLVDAARTGRTPATTRAVAASRAEVTPCPAPGE